MKFFASVVGAFLAMSFEISNGQSAIASSTKDLIIVRFFSLYQDELSGEGKSILTLEAEGKDGGKSRLFVNRKGVFADDKLLCDWPQTLGPLGTGKVKCPDNSPIQDQAFYGLSFDSAESTPFTAIEIIGIKDRRIEVPYKGLVYVGTISDEYKVVPVKGSKISEQVEKEINDRKKRREIELNKMGLAQARIAMLACLKSKNRGACLQEFLPSKKSKFSLQILDESQRLSVSDFVRVFDSDPELRGTFTSCLSAVGPHFRSGDSKNTVEIRFDEESEMYWECSFIQEGERWIFSGLRWSGC